MSNWWVQWAEQIASALAERWARTRTDGVGDRGAGTEQRDPAPADGTANALPDAPEPSAPEPQ